MVFVHDEDRVSRRFLSAVVNVASQDDQIVLPLRVADLGDRPADVRAPAILGLLAHAGQVVAPRRVASSLAPCVGIAFPRSLLTRQAFDPDLVIGEDSVLLGRLLSDASVTCAIPPTADEGVYYHAAGRNPGLARVASERLLAGLERLAALQLPSDMEPVRGPLLEAGVAEVNRYLQTHTDDHPAAIEQRRVRHLEAVVDLRRLNHRVARDLAVLYTAVPYVDTSATVAARRVFARQRIVDVIANDMSTRLTTDASSEAIWKEFVDIRIELDARPADIWWPGVSEFCHKGLAQITALERSKGPYRSVYSRAMHPTSHFLAAWFKLRRPEVTWYAEFSDPMRQNVQGEERPSSGRPDPVIMADLRAGLTTRGFAAPQSDNLFTWLETHHVRRGGRDHLHQRESARLHARPFPGRRGCAPAPREHSTISHHPVPEPWLYRKLTSSYELLPDKINLAYFGVFYSTRGLTEVWQALRRLPRAARQAIVLHVFTSKPDELLTQVADAGLTDVVVANPYVSYLEYLNLASRVDVLIINDARTVGVHDRNPYLPSKWSDYSGSGTPVWGIVEPGSILSGLLLDHRSELGDVDGALRVLADLIKSGPRYRGALPDGSD